MNAIKRLEHIGEHIVSLAESSPLKDVTQLEFYVRMNEPLTLQEEIDLNTRMNKVLTKYLPLFEKIESKYLESDGVTDVMVRPVIIDGGVIKAHFKENGNVKFDIYEFDFKSRQIQTRTNIQVLQGDIDTINEMVMFFTDYIHAYANISDEEATKEREIIFAITKGKLDAYLEELTSTYDFKYTVEPMEEYIKIDIDGPSVGHISWSDRGVNIEREGDKTKVFTEVLKEGNFIDKQFQEAIDAHVATIDSSDKDIEEKSDETA